MARLLTAAAVVLSVLTILSAIAFIVAVYVAIWTPGNDAWDATSFALLPQTAFLGLGAVIAVAYAGDFR